MLCLLFSIKFVFCEIWDQYIYSWKGAKYIHRQVCMYVGRNQNPSSTFDNATNKNMKRTFLGRYEHVNFKETDVLMDFGMSVLSGRGVLSTSFSTTLCWSMNSI